MKKTITYGIIGTGFLMFAGIFEESKAFLKIGVSSTMTSNMGASYGLGAKATLSQIVTTLESWINSLKNMTGKLKEINGKYYEFVPQETLVRIDASLKNLNSLRDKLVLIRDNKRVQLVKGKPLAVNLDEMCATFERILMEGEEVLTAMGEPNSPPSTESRTSFGMTRTPTRSSWPSKIEVDDDDELDDLETGGSETGRATSQFDELKIRDKNIQKATKAYKEAQQRVAATTENFRSAIRGLISAIERMEFQPIPVLKLEKSQLEARRDETIKYVEETMAVLKELNEKTRNFCAKSGIPFHDR
jgi:hypothetical protein